MSLENRNPQSSECTSSRGLRDTVCPSLSRVATEGLIVVNTRPRFVEANYAIEDGVIRMGDLSLDERLQLSGKPAVIQLNADSPDPLVVTVGDGERVLCPAEKLIVTEYRDRQGKLRELINTMRVTGGNNE